MGIERARERWFEDDCRTKTETDSRGDVGGGDGDRFEGASDLPPG